jgi:hypothetical protein
MYIRSRDASVGPALRHVFAWAPCVAFAVTACASATPITTLGNDTYVVTVTAQGDGGPMLKQRAVDIGQDQCTTNSRYFYIVSENTQPSGGGTSLTLTFKCLRGDDPMLHRPDTFKSN